MKNIMQIMQKAQQVQKSIEAIQEQIKADEFTSDSGGGLVKIIINGDYEIKKIEVDDSIISLEEKSLMLDLIIAAYNDARRKVKETTSERMQEATAGLPIPPGMKIPGLF